MIEPGDSVTVHYALWLEPGREVESTFGGEPLTFTYGSGELPAALERRLAGLDAGADAEFVIPASEGAFGAWDADNRHAVEREVFAAEQSRPGALVEFELPGGERVSGRIESVDADSVLVDFNHPLAGRDVQCRLKLVSVRRSGQST